MKTKTIFIALLFLLGLSTMIYGATLRLVVDDTALSDWRSATGTNGNNNNDPQLEALVNNYLIEQTAKANQEAMKQQYAEIGSATSNAYTQGQISEVQRIHACVFG